MSDRWLFGYRLDLVEWLVLLVVCAVVSTTLLNMSFTGPGVIFGGVAPGLGGVWLLRRFRRSDVHQPALGPARGEGSALLSLLLFAVGGFVLIMALMVGVIVCVAPKAEASSLAVALTAGLVGAAVIYAGVRVRRGGAARAKR